MFAFTVTLLHYSKRHTLTSKHKEHLQKETNFESQIHTWAIISLLVKRTTKRYFGVLYLFLS